MSSINIPLIVLLLQGIPEIIAIVTLAFVIAKINIKWNKILLIGVPLAVCEYVVRLFPIPFGIHTILLLILLFIGLTVIGKGEFSLSLIASLLSFLVLIICEFVCLSLLMPIFRVTPETLSLHPIIRIVIAEPHVLILFISAFLLNKFIQKKRSEMNEFL